MNMLLDFLIAQLRKIKKILTFENALKINFKEYRIETKKILSRGKCRGFIYIFSKDISRQSITEDSFFNFIENCLAVGLENDHLIKTKKKHENMIEKFPLVQKFNLNYSRIIVQLFMV